MSDIFQDIEVECMWIEGSVELTGSQFEKLLSAAPMLSRAWALPGCSDFWLKYYALQQGPWAVSDMWRSR